MADLRSILPLNLLAAQFQISGSGRPTLPQCSWATGMAACLMVAGMLSLGRQAIAQQPPAGPRESATPDEPVVANAALSQKQKAQIKQLIDNLGAPSFSEREKSAIALHSMGVATLPQLRLTLEATEDPEMRERTQQLINQLTNGRLEEQIKDFMAMKDIKFEGWIAIRNILGEDSSATRNLFVELLRQHPTLPASIIGTTRDRTLALQSIIESVQAKRLKQMPTTADAFALLLPILDEDVEMPSACEDLMIEILQKSTASVIRRDRRLSPSFKALLGRWMSRTTIPNRQDVLFYGLGWKLGTASRQLALDTLNNGPETGVTLLASALQALARHGVRADVATIRKLLDDKRPVTKGSRSITGKMLNNQLGDMAIATIASITGVALDDVGFTGVKEDQTYGFLIDEIGFPVDEAEKRQQARSTIDAILLSIPQRNQRISPPPLLKQKRTLPP